MRTLLFISAFCTIACTQSVFAQPCQGKPLTAYDGIWKNTNANTRAFLKVEIRFKYRNGLTVKLYNACTDPAGCDGGTYPGIAYSQAVHVNPVECTQGITLTLDDAPFTSLITIEPSGKDQIRVSLFVEFPESDTRNNYVVSEFFEKM